VSAQSVFVRQYQLQSRWEVRRRRSFLGERRSFLEDHNSPGLLADFQKVMRVMMVVLVPL